jgi:putative membrane protein
LIDAVPGLVMRLSTHPVSTFFDHRVALSGQPGQLRDQQIGGAILWCAAELLDLPFLFLIFRRWVRADAREAALVDATLDSETSETARLNNGQTTDEPWFLSDPQLRDRLR